MLNNSEFVLETKRNYVNEISQFNSANCLMSNKTETSPRLPARGCPRSCFFWRGRSAPEISAAQEDKSENETSGGLRGWEGKWEEMYVMQKKKRKEGGSGWMVEENREQGKQKRK